MITAICPCYFSATTTTDRVVNALSQAISEQLNQPNIKRFDFTLPDSRQVPLSFNKNELVIIGTPVIAGRVPNLLLPYLNQTKADNSYAVVVSLYGNRNYDDALMELSQIMKAAGAKVIAGGAFIGEHSFSRILGKGRPDANDMLIVKEFAKKISMKILNEDVSEPKIPGNQPLAPYYTPRDRHGNGIDIRKVKPKTNDKCINCLICAKSCPLGSINFDNVREVPGICMKCCACIKKCPTGAKYFDDTGYLYHMKELEDLYSKDRKEPEYYL